MICNLRGLSELKRLYYVPSGLERASAVIAAMTAICLSRRRIQFHVRFGESRVMYRIHETLRGNSSKSTAEEVRAEAAMVAQKRRSMIQLIIINRLLRLHFGLELVCQSV